MTDDHTDERRPWWPPSWFTLTIIAAVALLGLAAAVVWYEIADARSERRAECQQAIEFRQDNRAMWLELFDVFPDAADETGLRADLETLLPPLTCDGSTPTPSLGGTP